MGAGLQDKRRRGGCRDSCVFPKGGGWSGGGGVCYGNAYCRTNERPPLLSRVRGPPPPPPVARRGGGRHRGKGDEKKEGGWLLDTVAAAALTVSEGRSGCRGRGGGSLSFFPCWKSPLPLLWCAYQRREGEREEGGIGGDTHSDICIGRERDLRSLTGMAMFDALFSQSG